MSPASSAERPLRRRAVRAARRGEHLAARYAAAQGDPAALCGVAWDDWRAAVRRLPAHEQAHELEAMTTTLRTHAQQIKRRTT